MKFRLHRKERRRFKSFVVYRFRYSRNIPMDNILNSLVQACRINIQKELRFLTFRDRVITFLIHLEAASPGRSIVTNG